MNKENLRIVFMGTPDFAVASLRMLVENDYPVVGVVTMPDKPIGKHQSSLKASPVKQYALAQGLPLLQPERLKSPEFIEQLRSWEPNLQIVVAFRMLPEVVWNLPRMGTINLHASLLPQYRGAAPINWAIINGERETGVTTFRLNHDIDTGNILLRQKTPISDTDTAETLHDRLMHLGAQLLNDTLLAILQKTIHSLPQSRLASDISLNSAPKIYKELCHINWKQPTLAVYNHIRGLSPRPGAWTDLKTLRGYTYSLKIFETEQRILPHDLFPGTIQTDGKTYFDVATADGFLRLLSLQQAGKKRMQIDKFLRGIKI